MTDIQALLAACAQVEQEQDEAVLASVVKVEGSAYRRPGARMLISSLGTTEGTISGGCLESAVAKKARWLTERGQPVLQRYSSTSGEDEEDGLFGLGCNGTLYLLLERHSRTLPAPAIELLREVVAQGEPGAIARVIDCPARGGVRLGQYLSCAPGRHWRSDLPDGVAALLRADLQRTLDDRRSALCRYPLADGELEVFCEYLAPPRRLLVFGGGHDAQPLVAMARLMGWQVTLIDSRRHYARHERFPGAHAVRCIELGEPFDWPTLADGAAVLIMSHSYRQDRHWLKAMLDCCPFYLGQLGPRSRTERLLAEVCDPGAPQPGLAVLHYPMGLDIGGDTPQSVALAVLAEICAVGSGRQGGLLSGRNGDIHDREAEHGGRLSTVHAQRQGSR